MAGNEAAGPNRSFSARWGIACILAFAILARLGPILLERPMGHDSIEYENLADNLRAGRGYFLDIKAYWAQDVPVVHYGNYTRPVLLPFLLAMLGWLLPPLWALKLIGPLLYLGGVAFTCAALRSRIGPSVANGTALLLALNPVLLDLSLRLLSENAVLFSLGLLVWAFFGRRSAVLSGFACTLLYLARPNAYLAALVIGCYFFYEAVRRRSAQRLILFCLFAWLGPVLVIWMNLSVDAPPLLLPQNFSFRLISSNYYQDLMHEGRLYDSALALLAAEWRTVAQRIYLDARLYFEALLMPHGLGLLLALLPIAAAGLMQARGPRLWLLLGLIGAIDLLFVTFSWFAADSHRFIAGFIFTSIIVLTVGTFEILDREPLFASRRAWRSAAGYICLAVAALWCLMAAERNWEAVQNHRSWRGYSSLQREWTAPGVDAMAQAVLEAALRQPMHPIVLSNEPWLVHHRTRLPAAMLPLDLTHEEYLRIIRAAGATLVVMHEGIWPAKYNAHLALLRDALTGAGWAIVESTGEFEVWQAPPHSGRAPAFG